MKLFQIEEPDGAADPGAPGAAIGIDASGAEAVVAMSVGGNAAVLADREGFEQRLPVPAPGEPGDAWQEMLEGARLRAERAVARPVTHAVLVLTAPAGEIGASSILSAADRAGLIILRLAAASELASGTSPAQAAATLAEDLAPLPLPDAGFG